MDRTDRKILGILQADATTPLGRIADTVGLSTTPCWRRIQKLEEAGVIRRRVALLDPESLNLGVTIFVAIRTTQHTDDWLTQFRNATTDIPEILEIYRLSGAIDYLMKVMVPDIKSYDDVYKRLIRRVEIADVTSMIAMETIRETSALPLDYCR